MSHAKLRWALVLTALAVNSAAPTIAAQVTDACPGVAARVAAGRPNADDLSILMSCPRQRSTAFIAYLRSIKSNTDLAASDEPFWFASRFRDGDVYNALSALAADRSASSVTRSLSLLSLIHLEDRTAFLGYPELTSVAEGHICPIGWAAVYPENLVAGTALPAGHRARSGALAARLARDASAPAPVRSAARCLAAAAGYELLPGLESLPAGHPRKLELIYICGNKFAIRNANFSPELVTYRVRKSKETATFTVPPRTQSKPYGEISFFTAIKGTVEIRYQGSRIRTRSNGNTTCP